MKLTGKISEQGKLLLPLKDLLTDWINGNRGKNVELEIKVKRKII